MDRRHCFSGIEGVLGFTAFDGFKLLNRNQQLKSHVHSYSLEQTAGDASESPDHFSQLRLLVDSILANGDLFESYGFEKLYQGKKISFETWRQFPRQKLWEGMYILDDLFNENDRPAVVSNYRHEMLRRLNACAPRPWRDNSRWIDIASLTIVRFNVECTIALQMLQQKLGSHPSPENQEYLETIKKTFNMPVARGQAMATLRDVVKGRLPRDSRAVSLLPLICLCRAVATVLEERLGFPGFNHQSPANISFDVLHGRLKPISPDSRQSPVWRRYGQALGLLLVESTQQHEQQPEEQPEEQPSHSGFRERELLDEIIDQYRTCQEAAHRRNQPSTSAQQSLLSAWVMVGTSFLRLLTYLAVSRELMAGGDGRLLGVVDKIKLVISGANLNDREEEKRFDMNDGYYDVFGALLGLTSPVSKAIIQHHWYYCSACQLGEFKGQTSYNRHLESKAHQAMVQKRLKIPVGDSVNAQNESSSTVSRKRNRSGDVERSSGEKRVAL